MGLCNLDCRRRFEHWIEPLVPNAPSSGRVGSGHRAFARPWPINEGVGRYLVVAVTLLLIGTTGLFRAAGKLSGCRGDELGDSRDIVRSWPQFSPRGIVDGEGNR